jgi:hypothetical protein
MNRIGIFLIFMATCAFAQLAAPTLEQIKSAADAGDPVAQDKLADRVDWAQSEVWLRKAAAQGYPRAEGRLGYRLFMRAQLSPAMKPDARAAIADEAIKWATLAANQGDKQGQANLAQIYLEGKFVKQDLIEAYKWGDLSAKNPTPEFVITSGSSFRDASILQMNADQIAEARRRVAAFVPHQPQKSDLPEPTWVQKIKLSGISGIPDHRFAIINGKTFGKGDQIQVKIGGQRVTIHCMEIRESSVLISLGGIEGTRELKMP